MRARFTSTIGCCISISLATVLSVNLYAQVPSRFSVSKRMAAPVFAAHPVTVYCRCAYAQKHIDLNSCGLSQLAAQQRAHRLEWEHLMSVEHFGRHFACWRVPLCQNARGKPFRGRRCCEQKDTTFRAMESELYNLWPVVGAMNQARSNYRFGMLPHGEGRHYGCLVIDKTHRRVEPPDTAKGVVARAHLFMAQHYKIPLSASQKKLFHAWNHLHAPSAWERQWASQVASIEGYDNPYITHWTP